MEIINMSELDKLQIMQAARMLTEGIPKGYPTLDDALEEINSLLDPEDTLLAAVENGEVLGFGGILDPDYNGNVFELNPLVVRADRRREGIGGKIVSALEEEARKQGGLIIRLGADDEGEKGETSLANADLFDNLPEKLKNFNPGTHQSAFYIKLVYKIIGVMPDANGYGKPDIYLGKRL